MKYVTVCGEGNEVAVGRLDKTWDPGLHRMETKSDRPGSERKEMKIGSLRNEDMESSG